MLLSEAKPFAYRVPWKSSSAHLGDHRGTARGVGHEYRGNVPLIDYPDARRLDLRQSVRDPMEQIQVRQFNQDNTTPVFAVCDLSSSMQYGGRRRKLDLALEIAASVARSAYDNNDMFSLVSYHDHVVEEATLTLSHQVHQAFEVMQQLEAFERMRAGAEGVLEVPQYLSQHRGLVFWISDFHMPLALIEKALNMMSRHLIVPVVLWDEREYRKLPRFGFGNMLDPETGHHRTIFFRETVRQQFEAAFAERRQALEHLFLSFESPTLHIEGEYTPEAMSHYFEQYMNL